MKTKIGFIGGGNMGAAIAAGILDSHTVLICEPDKKRQAYLKRKLAVRTYDVETVVERSKYIILAVKPQNFDEILFEIRRYLNKEKLIISIAAGITTTYIEKTLGKHARVIRCMPNLAVQVAEGMTGVCQGKSSKKSDLEQTRRIFNCIGQTVVVDEKYMDAVTAISGSGPAYLFLFIECFINAARSLGFKKDAATKLAVQTLKGSMLLFEKSREDVSVLRQRVTSKGGTTAAALDVFAKAKFEKIFKEAVTAAQKRAKQLAIK